MPRATGVCHASHACPWHIEEPGTGAWTPDPGVAPSRRSPRATGPGGMDDSDSDEPDSEDDIADLTGSTAEQPDSLTCETATVTTAERTVDYDVDWDGIERSSDPCLLAVELLHTARATVGTSRWWTMRYAAAAWATPRTHLDAALRKGVRPVP